MAMTVERCAEILKSAGSRRVLVLGDMVVDEHIIGQTTRLSREAPVPVIEQTGHIFVPGGAANLAFNARTIGAEVSVCGLIGDDELGRRLRRMLDDRGIHTAGLSTEPNRPTSTKLRIWAGGSRQRQYQQVARVDLVDREAVSTTSQQELILYLEGAVPSYHGVIVSDYENGVVDSAILEFLLPLARAKSSFVMVDSHGRLERFRGVNAITPNQPEAEAELGRSLDRPDQLRAGGAELRQRLDCDHLLLTLGAEGMALFTRDQPFLLLPAHPVAGVADTTGAGDTVAAVFTLALLSGATAPEAAAIANAAGAVVVSKLGAATAGADEIAATFRHKPGA